MESKKKGSVTSRAFKIAALGSDTRGVLLLWIFIAGGAILVNMVFAFLGSYGCHRVAFRLLYSKCYG